MNGDVLTSLDFSEFLAFHKRTGSKATIALNQRHVDIDFGVIELDSDRRLRGYTEKPRIDYLVSMGVYAFHESILEYIPANSYLDIPDLMKRLLADGETVNGYIHEGYWLDIGRPDDYEKANEDTENIYRELGSASMGLSEKTILITGEEGFAGRHLLHALKRLNSSMVSLKDQNGKRVDIRDKDLIREGEESWRILISYIIWQRGRL